VLEGAVNEFIEMRRAHHPRALTTELLAIPVIDVDGVHQGDQGKARRPWDHNRDYHAARSRYLAVTALRIMIESADLPLYALDLHTPGIRGEIEEKPYIVASGGDDTASAEALIDALDETRTELLIFDQDWNTPTSAGQRCCAAWLRSVARTRIALTVEYPNAVNRGRPVTPTEARRYGAGLIRSLLRLIDQP